MPVGLIRFNERRQRPNQRISFIRALDGPDQPIALDILERVAAIVWPIMRDNHLAITSLDEFPPNREFWGRNFNAGECVQLVLKSPATGLWLPFQFIVKVMLHEMAHIKQMNHSKYFHQVRIGYEKEMSVLNARGYTGDGFWSTGHKLSGEATAPRVLADEELPENLCGGTYRKAKRVRRKLTYAEQKQRRKERKFGKSEGDSLGVDQRERAKLEHKSGKKAKDTTVKPRVAQSSRGRELRAQAALARLEAASQKAPPGPSSRKKEEDEDEEETEEDEDEYQEEEEGGAIDFGHGERVVKMEDGEDDNAGDEWEELQRQMRGLCATTSGAANGIAGTGAGPSRSNGGAPAPGKGTSNGSNDTQKNLDSYGARPETKSVDHQGRPSRSIIELDSDDEATEDDDTPPPPPDRPFRPPSASTGKKVSPQDKPSSTPQLRPASALPGKVASADLMSPSDSTSRACSVCTVDNPPQNATCHVCACVLDPRRTPSWLCTSKNCRSLGYANSLDAAICGACGARRSL